MPWLSLNLKPLDIYCLLVDTKRVALLSYLALIRLLRISAWSLVATFGGHDTFFVHQVNIQILAGFGFILGFLNLNFVGELILVKSFTSKREVLFLGSLVTNNWSRGTCLVIRSRSFDRLMNHGCLVRPGLVLEF